MASEKEEHVHGYVILNENPESHTIKNILDGWKEHESDFNDLRRLIDNGSDHKTYVSEKVVFEAKGGKYIIRKSNRS